MSYIRCLCNPESLYVYGGHETHDFCWTDHHGNQQSLHIPNDDFDEFFRQFKKWNDWSHDLSRHTFEHKGIKLRTVIFDEELKRVLTGSEIEQRVDIWDGKHENQPCSAPAHLICLTYKNYPPLLMWEVTWDYLRDSVYNHLFRPCWFVRKIKSGLAMITRPKETKNSRNFLLTFIQDSGTLQSW